jgi:hypothetical protein
MEGASQCDQAETLCSIRTSLGAANQAEQEKDGDGADCGTNDRADNSMQGSDAQQAEQPATDKGADNADHDIAEQAETVPLHDEACEPARDGANKEPDKQSAEGHDVKLSNSSIKFSPNELKITK